MWFSALKLGLNAATHIYKKKQETKMAMADAQHMHASKMAKGESEYQGKLLEARQSDNPAKNSLKINSDSRSKAMKSISCRWVSSILEKSFILMKTACSSSPGQGLLVLLLWEKLNFIPEIHFLAGEGLFSYSDSSLTFQADCSRF